MSPQGFYLLEENLSRTGPRRGVSSEDRSFPDLFPELDHAACRNGLQLECLAEYPTFFRDYYYKLLARIMTFPLHTIAAINGHCFAGGLCLALACDWRICRVRRLLQACDSRHTCLDDVEC